MSYIYARHHFIFDYIEDKTVKIKLICSEDNFVYSLTKNLSNRPFHLITSR